MLKANVIPTLNRSVIILIFTMYLGWMNAQDTSYYPNGAVKEICKTNNGNRQCLLFEMDGSSLRIPHTVRYINYLFPIQQNIEIDIKTITYPKPLTEIQFWRLSKLLDQNKFNIEENQSFSIKVNDTISSYFISAINDGRPEYFIYMNDSTFITLHYPIGVMIYPTTIAVSFKDLDKNGRSDIVCIIEYITGVGPHGTKERYDSVILLNKANGFEERFFSGFKTISEVIQKFQSE